MIGCKIVTETKASSYMLTPYIYTHKKAILEAWVGGLLVLSLKLKCSESIASRSRPWEDIQWGHREHRLVMVYLS